MKRGKTGNDVDIRAGVYRRDQQAMSSPDSGGRGRHSVVIAVVRKR